MKYLENTEILFLVLFTGIVRNFGFTQAAVSSNEFTKPEKDALTKFRPMVQNLLTQDYMKTDEYLIPWLRTKKLDLSQAKEFLVKSLQWRQDNRMDNILKEDFTKYRKEYPVFFDGVDKEGRPITTYLFGIYDFRKIAIAGEMKEFQRYLNRNFEETARRIREMGHKNITDDITIFDLYGFNARQHLCLQCLSIYSYFVRTYEANYPQMGFKTYFVNMPTIFEQVLQIIRPLFSEHTADSIQFLGLNKEVWKRELLKQIPSQELFRQFGGSRTVKPGDGF